MAFALNLGPTNSWSTTVHTKPFSTSVLQGLIRLFATTTKICTNDGSMQSYDKHFYAHHCTFLLVNISKFIKINFNKSYILTAMYRYITLAPSILRASCFGRWVVTHSLANYDFHVHRPAILSNQRLSWYLHELLI